MIKYIRNNYVTLKDLLGVDILNNIQTEEELIKALIELAEEQKRELRGE